MTEERGHTVLYLSAEDCRALLDVDTVLDAVEAAFRMASVGSVRWSEPSSLRVAGGHGGARLRVKACVLEEPGVVGVRTLLFPPGGTETRWVLVFEEATGAPLAIVDEAWTFAHRSIASLVLVAHRLRPSQVRTVSILGAGRIAAAALGYVARLFPGASVMIASRRDGPASDLAAIAHDRHGLEAASAPIEAAVREAQVVLGCTNAASPVIRDPWVGPGAVVGSLEPRECDPALFARADLRVVDSREQLRDELVEAFGPGAPARVDVTMAEVVAGSRRTADGGLALVLSQGLVSQDVLLATRAYLAAQERGIGTPLPLAR